MGRRKQRASYKARSTADNMENPRAYANDRQCSPQPLGNQAGSHQDQDSDKPTICFNDLPDDVIYMILKYLSPLSLCRLRCVSRRFLVLASKDVVWLPHAKRCGFVKGSKWRECSAMEVCRVAPRWKEGLFKQLLIARHKTKQIPWLCKDEGDLWLSKSSCIHFFHAQPKGHFMEDRTKCLQGGTGDLTRFVVRKGTVVSGCSDGSVCYWDTSDNQLFSFGQVHKSETHCVDFTDSLVVSGSRDTTCKVLRFDRSRMSQESPVLKSFESRERVWSLKISPSGKFFAAGLAGCLDDPPMILWDLESGGCLAELSVNHRRGAGVLDMRFESPSELLTCGYDTFIRLWDLRTNSCVRQWEEPNDSALYCIETDGEHAMVVGTAHHGMVRLWDKRHSEPVQMMYCKNSRSPVYSLAMDYGHLYIALDTGLTIMDFT